MKEADLKPVPPHAAMLGRKMRQAGTFFLFLSPCLKERALTFWKILWDPDQGKSPLSQGLGEGAQLGLVLVDLSTGWHPCFFILVLSFSLEEKLVEIIIEQMQPWLRFHNLWSWLHILSGIMCYCVSDRAVFTVVSLLLMQACLFQPLWFCLWGQSCSPRHQGSILG